MIAWGVNALNHGSSLAVFKNGEFIQGVVSKDSDNLTADMYRSTLEYQGPPDRIFWYENPWVKKARQIYAGQYKTAFSLDNLPSRKLKEWRLGYAPITYTPHHASHAAAGYYTSPFNHCAVVVIDAIGEFECATIWNCMHGEMKKVWSTRYPHSLGLFYSAFTQMLGMKPIQDEHLLMKMAEQGDPSRFRSAIDSYFNPGTLNLKYNFHRGVLNWDPPPQSIQEQCDIAAAVQEKFENTVRSILFRAKDLTGSDCLVYMGGCAMNSVANKKALEYTKFKYFWSLPDPGDSSSSLGAVLYHTKTRVWRDWGPVNHLEIKV